MTPSQLEEKYKNNDSLDEGSNNQVNNDIENKDKKISKNEFIK